GREGANKVGECGTGTIESNLDANRQDADLTPLGPLRHVREAAYWGIANTAVACYDSPAGGAVVMPLVTDRGGRDADDATGTSPACPGGDHREAAAGRRRRAHARRGAGRDDPRG